MRRQTMIVFDIADSFPQYIPCALRLTMDVDLELTSALAEVLEIVEGAQIRMSNVLP